MSVPAGFSNVTPYIFVEQAAAYIRFLVVALGGQEVGRNQAPDGRIRNCHMRIGAATIMLSEASAAFPASAAAFYLYVENADEAMRKALDNGAEEVMAVADMPYGDRQGGVRDPAGNLWWISQRLSAAPYY